jgi:S-adenosylmethionine:tRNA ribosyltransferase-isomerase
MRIDELDFDLPPERIATEPARPRDAARLMVVRREAGTVEDAHVRDLPELLSAGDVMVVNDTAVHPARLIGAKRGSGGRVEGLFLAAPSPGRWRVLLRGGRLRAGVSMDLEPVGDGQAATITLLERDAEAWLVAVEESAGAGAGAAAVLDRVGRTPLPPYILAARWDAGLDVADARDRDDYQTIYADADRAGSVAAPTAGLHFTPELLERLAAAGIDRRALTLHVGEGTFRPVTADTLEEHRMHHEWCAVPSPVLEVLAAREAGGGPRVIAIGTTSVRALESVPTPVPALAPGDGPWTHETDLLIQPGWRFRHVDGMLTNFHLPRSTLIALVAGMIGLDRTLELYRRAVDRGYRFYSYGDAMVILP